MNDTDALVAALEDCTLTFGTDLDLQLIPEGGESLGSWDLDAIIDGMIETMSAPTDRDNMIDLARHFERLATRIRNVIADIEER